MKALLPLFVFCMVAHVSMGQRIWINDPEIGRQLTRDIGRHVNRHLYGDMNLYLNRYIDQPVVRLHHRRRGNASFGRIEATQLRQHIRSRIRQAMQEGDLHIRNGIRHRDRWRTE